MAQATRDDVRNLAIIAHVDHGKTTLVDALRWHAGAAAEPVGAASAESERAKAITSMPQVVSLEYRGTRIHIVDTPGQADPADEVERMLGMADGMLLVVDACEGSAPETRFPLREAIRAGLTPVVVVNKIDLPRARPAEVLREIRETLRDLEATEAQIDCPVLYCNAREGLCRSEPEGEPGSMEALLETILSTVPAPTFDPAAPARLLVRGLDYDDFLGRLALGRLHAGRLTKGATIAHCRLDGSVVEARVEGLFGHDGVRRIEWERAGPGDVVSIAGAEGCRIGETIADAERPAALPAIEAEEPVVGVVLGVNDSPFAGLDGSQVSVGRLRERLWREILTNPSVRVEEIDTGPGFLLLGRGELQLAILIEMMRREGYEMTVGRPGVSTRTCDGRVEEPLELLLVDCPEQFAGVIQHKVEARRGRAKRMVNHGTGRVRLEFEIPSRGLIGFRAELLGDTRRTGIMSQRSLGYAPWHGEIVRRTSGSLVADREGRATAHAIEHLQHRGSIFVEPGDHVYEGMIVGENTRAFDVDVNIVKARPPRSDVPASPDLDSPRLIPPRSMSLEQALEFLHDDELVEATPLALRLRKKVLRAADR